MPPEPPSRNGRKALLLAAFVAVVILVWLALSNLNAGRHNGAIDDGRPPDQSSPAGS